MSGRWAGFPLEILERVRRSRLVAVLPEARGARIFGREAWDQHRGEVPGHRGRGYRREDVQVSEGFRLRCGSAFARREPQVQAEQKFGGSGYRVQGWPSCHQPGERNAEEEAAPAFPPPVEIETEGPYADPRRSSRSEGVEGSHPLETRGPPSRWIHRRATVQEGWNDDANGYVLLSLIEIWL